MVNVAYPLNANSKLPTPWDNHQKCLQTLPNVPWGQMALAEKDYIFLHLPIPLPVCWVCPCLTLRVLPVYTPSESVSAPMCSALSVCLCALWLSVGVLYPDSLYTCLCRDPV